jgi:hypothetical protein
MFRSFLGRKRVLVGLAIGIALAFTAFAMPALGGPSLKQLVKKEVTKQLKGKTGPPGPPGAKGATGPSAASSVSTTVGGAVGDTDTQFLSTQITLTSDSLIQANAMLALSVTGTPRGAVCFIKVNATDISTRSEETIPNGQFRTSPVVGAISKPAGTYTVTAGCQNGGGTGSLHFDEGNLNVIAAG